MKQDVVIVGAGMVGAAAAIGLAKLGLSVAVIDAFAPKPYEPEQALDIRVSAISVASEKLLDELGALTPLLTMRNAPYLGLETWELDGCKTAFHASQVDTSHLGHIIENRLIQLALWQQFESYPNLTLFCPHKVAQFSRHKGGVLVRLDNGDELDAKLLIAADGANSQVRQWAGIGITAWDYSQSAMLINISTAESQQDVTWQQFTKSGPRSLLPLPGNNASLVWYDDSKRIKQLAGLSNSQLKQQICEHFPKRLNRDFEVLNHGHFGLTRRHAQHYYADNVLLLGDAAHTINPLAGQGVNLGFKDVVALLDVMNKAISAGDDIAQTRVLAEYQQARYHDNLLMMSAMDMFYFGFSNDLLPLKLLRNTALKLANIDNPIKRKVLKYAMGL